MFRPLKNFLTYIQKNASSTSIFRGPIETAEVLSTTRQRSIEENLTGAFEGETSKLEDTVKTNVKKIVCNHNSQENLTESVSVNDFSAIDVDDIETQIKSNIMVRKSRKSSISTKLPDLYQNHIDNSDGSDDFYTSAASTADSGALEEPEVLVSEDEEPNFLNVGTHELLKFPSNELIVLNEPELNNSISSDEFSEDPLAIDDFDIQHPSFEAESLNLLEPEQERSNDDFWFGVNDIKECSLKPDLERRSCSDSTPVIKPTAPITPKKQEENGTDIAKTSLHAKSLEVREVDENPEELRSEGSDSGLGSETSTLQIAITTGNGNIHCNAGVTPYPVPPQSVIKTDIVLHRATDVPSNLTQTEPILLNSDGENPSLQKPLKRSNLKRRLDESGEDATLRAITQDDDPSMQVAALAHKKPKRSINFDHVQVFYFPRQQGFGCVPSAGGCTLGMGAEHVSFKTLTLAEHAAELRRAHRQQLQEVSPRVGIGSSSEESEESEEDFLSEGSGSDADAESSGFLQPVSPKQRRALLKAAGVRKIDATEKAECRDIRNSREICGCTCRDFCDPETCACSQAGIKCQVDRAMFPCGCSRDACGNTVGRVEFNPSRVRTHFIHTIMRLEMEARQLQKPNHVTKLSCGGISPPSTPLNQIAGNYYSMQPPQSNYSSGYASPAYPPLDQTTSSVYYQENEHNYIGEGMQQNPPSHSVYQVDGCLGANVFPGINSAPSYGDLISSTYNGNHTPIIYNNISNGIEPESSIPTLPYASYSGIDSSRNYLPITTGTSNTNVFSSCAVPSAPPFGSATTTAASAQYHSVSNNISNCSLDSITITSSSLANGSTIDNAASFIDLNSPVSSSSRLSVINDLLQHNRNTKAALIAVSSTTTNTPLSLCSTSTDVSIDEASLITPPTLACGLTFGGLTTPLIPTLVETDAGVPTKPLQTEPPPPSAAGIADILVIASN